MIVTTSNLDYLIDPVRLHVGDMAGSTFSDGLVLTSLVFGVKYLQHRWNSKYLIYASGMLVSGTTVNTPQGQCTLDTLPNENDVFRNCYATFTSDAPPIIDQSDEYAIVLTAAILLRRSVFASSISVFSNWSTPDLSFSNVASHKALLDTINADVAALDMLFKGKLAAPQKSTWPIALEYDYF